MNLYSKKTTPIIFSWPVVFEKIAFLHYTKTRYWYRITQGPVVSEKIAFLRYTKTRYWYRITQELLIMIFNFFPGVYNARVNFTAVLELKSIQFDFGFILDLAFSFILARHMFMFHNKIIFLPRRGYSCKLSYPTAPKKHTLRRLIQKTSWREIEVSGWRRWSAWRLGLKLLSTPPPPSLLLCYFPSMIPTPLYFWWALFPPTYNVMVVEKVNKFIKSEPRLPFYRYPDGCFGDRQRTQEKKNGNGQRKNNYETTQIFWRCSTEIFFENKVRNCFCLFFSRYNYHYIIHDVKEKNNHMDTK